jgi:DNA-binding CsgD family transcriptional regulator
MTGRDDVTGFEAAPAPGDRPPLTRREREILALLAEGMSGAQIAEKLVLSPETVRTHVRNAMAKLGASTRSQAVALALQREEISGAAAEAEAVAQPESGVARELTDLGRRDFSAALGVMLDGLVSLYDVDGGAVYLTEEDGLSLRQVGASTGSEGTLPAFVFLGEGALGRAALERRAQLFQDAGGGPAASGGAVIAAPILASGRLLGVIALAARVSRPIGRSELLLLQAFATRVGEVLLSGADVEAKLARAMDRFRGSWAGTPRVL